MGLNVYKLKKVSPSYPEPFFSAVQVSLYWATRSIRLGIILHGNSPVVFVAGAERVERFWKLIALLWAHLYNEWRGAEQGVGDDSITLRLRASVFLYLMNRE